MLPPQNNVDFRVACKNRPSLPTGECTIRASFSIKGVKLITTTGITINDANRGAEQVRRWPTRSAPISKETRCTSIEIAEKTKAGAMKFFEQEMEK